MEQLIVQTRYGSISGVREGCIVFKGIPYAKAPVGELRFRAPQPCEAWEGVRQADRYPNRSIQAGWDAPDGFFKREFYSISGFETPMSEDSLYLNVWTPRLGPQERMPVLFYIHGGGFVGGYGHEPEFCTDAYARRGVVLVTINYRLGIFGYLAHPWLTAADTPAPEGWIQLVNSRKRTGRFSLCLSGSSDIMPVGRKMQGETGGIMSKYKPLWQHIQATSPAILTFDKLEQVCGFPIDHSFLKAKKELEAYGFKVGKISMKEKTIRIEQEAK